MIQERKLKMCYSRINSKPLNAKRTYFELIRGNKKDSIVSPFLERDAFFWKRKYNGDPLEIPQRKKGKKNQ